MAHKAVWTGIGGVALIAILASALAQGKGTAEYPQSPLTDSVCINEFLPKPVAMSEFIELYNYGSEAVSLVGWQVGASPGTDCENANYKSLTGTLSPGGYLAIYGLQLSDSAGCVLLLRDGAQIASKTYTSPQSGLSIGRWPDGGSQWRSNLTSSPGRSNTSPPPSPAQTATPSRTSTRTPTRTLTLTPVRTATSTRRPNDTPGPPATACPTRNLSITVCISEFLPAPGSDIDWDGDGEANWKDEWIELHNASAKDLDLCGWMLDDRAGEGSQPYTFPAGTRLLAGGYHAYYLRDTGVALNNSGGDDVRLLAPDGTVVDIVSYEQTTYDASYSRTGGCTGEWTTVLPPSPGQANPVPTPTLASMPLYLPLLQRVGN